MMQEYRFTMLTLREPMHRLVNKDGVELLVIDDLPKLTEKWLKSDVSVVLFEHCLRQIMKDTPTFNQLKKLVLTYATKEHLFNSEKMKNLYYEVKQILVYFEEVLLIDEDEGRELIESKIVKVSYKHPYLDVITILNEREIHGKLQSAETFT